MWKWKNKIIRLLLVWGFDDVCFVEIQVTDTDGHCSSFYILEGVIT